MQRVIVTGGAGYIGSHICVDLLNAGCEVLVIDNFENSSPVALERIKTITGRSVEVVEADLADAHDKSLILKTAQQFAADCAIHLAGLKAVGESVAVPARYYNVNINATLTLIDVMAEIGAKNIVFSSSATVYGDLSDSPVDESAQTGPTNPYGRTKYFIEHILRDLAEADHDWRIVSLRYFNPVGAHESGMIGEDPNGAPNNLFPFIAQVAVGKRERLHVFGNDYDTPDGTGVRDYIHVSDLSRGHVLALDFLQEKSAENATTINLGAGRGYSVLEVISAFEAASGRHVAYDVTARRDGDVATIYAKPDRAHALLGWRAEKNLNEMCEDTWRWQSNNPNGYSDRQKLNS